MPLKIVLKPGEKIIINGAVLENVGAGMKALILNEAAVLREKDIITEKDAVTPASRAYFVLQNLYLFPHKAASYAPMVKRLFGEFAAAVPSSKPLVDEILSKVSSGQLYKALRQAQKLVEHEGRIFAHVEQELQPAVRDGSEGREPETDGSLGADGSGKADEGGPERTG